MRFWMHALFAATFVAQAQAPTPKAVSAVEQRLRRDVTFLVSPALMGRP